MAEFTLRRKEAETLKLNIGEESFFIPLAGSLTPDEAAPLDTPEGTRAFFQKYLSEELRDSLTLNDYEAITKAWVDASKKSAKKKPGES